MGYRCHCVAALTDETQFQKTSILQAKAFLKQGIWKANIFDDDDDVKSGSFVNHLSSKHDWIASSLQEFDNYEGPRAYSHKIAHLSLLGLCTSDGL